MRYLLIILVFSMAACEPVIIDQGSRMAYVPVYASAQDANAISVEPVKPTVKAGKIYAYNQYLFQVEQFEGIHIIDNSNPQQAHKLAFIKIPLCSELAIKSGFLYTNNLNDLVVFNLSNISAPQLVNRVVNAFPAISQEYPPFDNVYFECVDPSKGFVVGWDQKPVENPKCRR
ncbi:MAG: hypothetical protein ACXWB9_08840 [Flavisolibacter sp.]